MMMAVAVFVVVVIVVALVALVQQIYRLKDDVITRNVISFVDRFLISSQDVRGINFSKVHCYFCTLSITMDCGGDKEN